MSGVLDRLLDVGSRPTDDAETRLRRRGVMLTAWTITLLATIWVVVYLALGRPLSAAIPFAYQVGTLAGIALVARRGWSRTFFRSQIVLILILPALLQWSLGGFVNGSAVIVWAFTGSVVALIFASRRAAVATFLAFAALVVLSGVIDGRLRAATEPLPEAVILLFFVLDISVVGAVAFGALVYFIHERDRAQLALQAALGALDAERTRSETLLRNILPDAVAERLKSGERVIADRYDEVTVLFADIVGFAPMAAQLPPDEVVSLLDGVFGDLDELAAEHGLIRIKTMGDAYMAAAGVPEPRPAVEGALAAARMALGLVDRLAVRAPEVRVRVGMHTGPAVAGVIGRRTYAYDVWGDAVNVASRMESQGLPGEVQVSARTYDLIAGTFPCRHRGVLDVKGLGPMHTYLLEAPRPVGGDPSEGAAASRSTS